MQTILSFWNRLFGRQSARRPIQFSVRTRKGQALSRFISSAGR